MLLEERHEQKKCSFPVAKYFPSSLNTLREGIQLVGGGGNLIILKGWGERVIYFNKLVKDSCSSVPSSYQKEAEKS